MRHYFLLAKESALLPDSWIRHSYVSPDVDAVIPWDHAYLQWDRCQEWLTRIGYRQTVPPLTIDEIFDVHCFSLVRLTYKGSGEFQEIEVLQRQQIGKLERG